MPARCRGAREADVARGRVGRAGRARPPHSRLVTGASAAGDRGLRAPHALSTDIHKILTLYNRPLDVNLIILKKLTIYKFIIYIIITILR